MMRGVGRRPAHAQLLERLDQRGLGVAGRRLGGVALGLERPAAQRVADGQRRQPDLLVLQLGVGVVGALDVGPQEAGERDDLAAGGELGVLPRRRHAAEAHLDALAPGVGHLRGDGPHPDQLVQPALVAVQAGLLGGAEGLAGGADGLVGLLGVLDLLVVARGAGPARTRARTGPGPATGRRRWPPPTAWWSRSACR